MIGECRVASELTIGRLPIALLTIADLRMADCAIADWIGDYAVIDPPSATVNQQSPVVNPSIGNQHSVDRRSPIANSSIGSRQSPIGRDVWDS
jgi:hypothetical protein